MRRNQSFTQEEDSAQGFHVNFNQKTLANVSMKRSM